MNALPGLWIVAVLVFVIATAPGSGATAQTPSDGSAPTLHDAALEQETEQLLSRIAGVEEVEVALTGDEVILTGVADDPELIDLAGSIAESTIGAPVRNEMRLSSDFAVRLHGAATRLGDRLERWLAFLPLIPLALLILLACIGIAWAVGRWKRFYRASTGNPFIGDIVRRLVQAGIIFVGILIALEVLGATAMVGGILGAAGVVGITVGFGFRDIIENYISGILLSFRQPFRPHHRVAVGGFEGLVTAMNTRTTILTTSDGNTVEIPNSTVFKTPIINYSAEPRRRFSFEIGIGRETRIEEAINLAVQTLRSTDGVLNEPPPQALVSQLGELRITVQLFGWVDQSVTDLGKVMSSAMQRLKTAYEQRGIWTSPHGTYQPGRATREQGTHHEPPIAKAPGNGQVGPAHDVARDDTTDQLAAAAARQHPEENLLAARPDGR